MANQNGPFTEMDLEEINARLTELDEADRIMAQAVQAGIDIEPHQSRSRELRQKLLRMKQAFFPGK